MAITIAFLQQLPLATTRVTRRQQSFYLAIAGDTPAATVRNHVWNCGLRGARSGDAHFTRRTAPLGISRPRFRRPGCRAEWTLGDTQMRGTHCGTHKTRAEGTGIGFPWRQPHALGHAWHG